MNDLTAEQLAMFRYNQELDKARRQRDDVLIDIGILKKENSALQEKLEIAIEYLATIQNKKGMCIFGSSDTSEIPDVAFRQGSAYTYGECASIATEALNKIRGENR